MDHRGGFSWITQHVNLTVMLVGPGQPGLASNTYILPLHDNNIDMSLSSGFLENGVKDHDLFYVLIRCFTCTIIIVSLV